MKEGLNKIFEIILNDEKEANKFLAIQTIEEMYEYFKYKIPNLTENEFDDYLSEVLERYENNIQNNLQKIDKGNLDKVAGGRNLIKKLSASALAATSLLTGVTAFAGNDVNTGSAPSPTYISKHTKNGSKNQNDPNSKFPKTKRILGNPYVKAAGGGMGLGALVFGGPPILKRILSHKNNTSPKNTADLQSFPDPQINPAPQVVADPDIPLPDDWTPLHREAAGAGDVDYVGKFSNMPISLRKQHLQQRDSLGRTPLYIAFKYGNQRFIGQLIGNHNFAQLYPLRENIMWHLFVFDVWCTAAKLDDTATLQNLYTSLPNVHLFFNESANLDPDDYSYLNGVLRDNGWETYHELKSYGVGYSLLDIAFRHNAMRAAEYLIKKGVSYNVHNIFHRTNELTAKNKLSILNFMVTHGLDFAEFYDRGRLISTIFKDENLSTDNLLEILRFLKNHNYRFLIEGENTLINEPIAYLRLAKSISYPHGTVLFKFYIDDLNILSHMNDDSRNSVRTYIHNYIESGNPYDQFFPNPHPVTKSQARELLNYFNQKCREQPYTNPTETS